LSSRDLNSYQLRIKLAETSKERVSFTPFVGLYV